MIGKKSVKTVCVIPARLNSKRFPKKVLSSLGSKPMLQWIWERALSCAQFDQVAFAIDHEETAALIKSFQGVYFMTDPDCQSGTDRLASLMRESRIEGDIWVNWQGDEPFIQKRMIQDLLQSCERGDADVWTLKKEILKKEEIQSPHVVKVVSNKRGEALYFSRAPIPYARNQNPIYYKHIGLYAYTGEALQKIWTASGSQLENAESLEQLRFIEEGLKIKVHETDLDTQSIDTPRDLLLALKNIDRLKDLKLT